MLSRKVIFGIVFFFCLVVCVSITVLRWPEKAVWAPGESFLIKEKVPFSVMVSGKRITITAGFADDVLRYATLHEPSGLTLSNISFSLMHSDYPFILVEAEGRISPDAPPGKKVIKLSLPNLKNASSAIGGQVIFSSDHLLHLKESNTIEIKTIEVR